MCPNGCRRFFIDFSALFMKMFRLSVRRRGQTIVEIVLAYAFMALLLGLRYLLDRAENPAFQLPPFRPHDNLVWNNTPANTTYYYPCKFQLFQ